MIKLIVLDCDGTLLNSRKQITSKTLSAVRNLVSKDIKVMIASARPFYRLRKILQQLGIEVSDQYTISFNGGLITNNDETDTVFSRGFSKDEILEIIQIGKQFNTKMFLYTRNAIFSNEDDELYRKKNPDVNFNVCDLYLLNYGEIPIYKIAYVNTPENTIILRSNLPKFMFSKYEISGSVPQFVEIVSKGITKAKALEIVISKLGILPKEIMAFGDQDNDLPMLNYVGCGVAMGNSPEFLKEAADYVTLTNDEDGVASAIEHFFAVD